MTATALDEREMVELLSQQSDQITFSEAAEYVQSAAGTEALATLFVTHGEIKPSPVVSSRGLLTVTTDEDALAFDIGLAEFTLAEELTTFIRLTSAGYLILMGDGFGLALAQVPDTESMNGN